MSRNVIFHRFLRYRRERTSPITPTDPNLSKRRNKRAVKRSNSAKRVSVYPCTQIITHFTPVSMVWSNQAPVACLYPGKVALHKRIRHPRPPVTGGDRSGSAGEEVNKLKKHRNER